MEQDIQELMRLRKRRRNLEELYDEALRQEQELAEKLKAERGPAEAPLADRYERTFTGTFVGRKLLERDYYETVDKGSKGKVQADNGSEEERAAQRGANDDDTSD